MNFLSNQQQGALYTISSGLCYGFLGYFGVSILNTGLSVSNMLFWRFLVAALFMLIILAPQYKILFQNPKESFKVLFYGMGFYSVSTIIYFVASTYIGTGLAMVIFFTYPAIVMLLNVIFYRTKVTKIYYLSFAMIIIGIMCLGDLSEFKFDIFGIGLGVLSAIFYAFYIVASKKNNLSPMASTLMVSSGCAITCFISAWIDSSFYVPQGLNSWFNIICIALICTAVPILLLLQGLKYISAEKASMLSVLEPVFVVILGIVLLDEKVTSMQIVGTIIMLSGALMTFLRGK